MFVRLGKGFRLQIAGGTAGLGTRFNCGCARYSTGNSGHFFVSRPQPAPNRSICSSNTTSCALYLTHPTEGGTFTTAPLQSVEQKYRKSGPQTAYSTSGRASALPESS